jgi:hypothetical protein
MIYTDLPQAGSHTNGNSRGIIRMLWSTAHGGVLSHFMLWSACFSMKFSDNLHWQ